MKTLLSALSLRGLAAGAAALLAAGAGVAVAAPAQAADVTVDMPYPIPVSELADGIPVTVTTDPGAEVDVRSVNAMFNGGYTLPIEDVDRFNGAADESGEYSFTLAADDAFVSSFKPERNATVGELQPNEAVVVQVSSASKSTSKTTVVTYDAGHIAGPETATVAEAQAGLAFSVQEGPAEGYSYSPAAALGDEPITDVAPESVGPAEEFTVTAPDSVAVGDEITVSAETVKGSNRLPDTLPVTRHTVRIVEEPTEDPTEDPTDDPTVDPTDDPTVDPTDDPSTPAERELIVDPEKIAAADFVKADAVTIVATGCEPGKDAELTVTPESENIGTHVDTATADADGTVPFTVFGDNPKAAESYIGAYDVVVACPGGDDLTGAFTVTAGDGSDDDGSGGDDKGKDDNGKNGDDKRDDRSRLPRTGSEFTAAGAGLALLAIGTAGIMLTRRRS
ncbi:LPXTG cell wall anchor domain-containing protein [Brevibacterium luteolum]|uniref:LPXTG cell wall anchor domain-containing protein n=1 Tax=Brevibacterium luteolum TaxID=199591 RepID=UPI0021AE48BF|nr:LPXTG cell wall anchor domain-containing protein [Brevibacterium luteolum]MCT1873326.1 LPXTG cell wall anchor domain-containing protein [Brevibacterium luteolum]MCT1889982.1 LPXTG cell wall anchor domain-containing protein [Brevibacterium luteolum]MCT1892573.1 LPXTG cell wall anchor domain-containing protein [Brevibacterium luteolum]MCT1923072.1 LPXTG cell wall anchor domain-containing protein [Brevibacterium luteolum]